MIILMSFISGLFYRLGGWGQEGRDQFPKLPGWFFDTKVRDIGCAALVTYAVKMTVPAPWWVYSLSFLLLFGALTTYWDWLFGEDTFWFHGLACGAALLPLAIVGTGVWEGVLVRAVILACFMGILSAVAGDDFIEEFGRGFSLVITILLLKGG
jgi:hypothetical protein